MRAGRCAPPDLLPHPGTKPGNHGKGNLVFSCFALNPFLSQSSGQLLGSPHPGPHPHRPEAPFRGHRSRDQLRSLPARPPPSWSRWSFALTLKHSGTCLLLRTPWSRALPARLLHRLPDHSLVALTARPPPQPCSHAGAGPTGGPWQRCRALVTSPPPAPSLTCCGELSVTPASGGGRRGGWRSRRLAAEDALSRQ